jgi:multiple sugar transport system ATP-binding protein
VSLGVRPEDLAIVEGGGNAWTLAVDVIEQHGSNAYLHCSPAGNSELLLHIPGQTTLRQGDRLHVRPVDGRWHVFDQDERRVCAGAG